MCDVKLYGLPSFAKNEAIKMKQSTAACQFAANEAKVAR